jgi:hypothetical protein
MLLTLLIWAWAHGVRSSRVVERLCQRDVAYRIICAGDAPDHVTISRFRADTAQVVEELFAQVLMLCAGLGMGQLGVVAVDSVKIASNASLAANRTEDGLAKAAAEQARIDAQRAREVAAAAAAQHAVTDAAEDAMYGPGRRGDELPAELVDERSRAARIAQALAELHADTAAHSAERDGIAERQQDRQQRKQQRKQAKLDAYRRQRADRGSAPVGKPPTEIRIEVLTENLAAAQARQQAKVDRYLAGGCVGRAPLPPERNAKVNRVKAALDRAIAEAAAREQAQVAAAERAAARRGGEPRRNITDPQSRMMPLRGGGWVQGYNCQAATSSDGLIIATSVGNNSSDATAFGTIVDKATAAAVLIDAHRRDGDGSAAGIGVVLADAGYLSIDNLTEPGPDRLIAVGKSRDLATAAREEPTTGPPPPEATPIEAMAHRLRTPEGHALYKQRSHIAETPFAHAKHNLGFRRFTSRGINRAAAEFNFHALVHNLFKAIGTAALTPAAG